VHEVTDRILVVDDDDPIRQLLVDVLTSEGYLVSEAVHGREALDALARAQPDGIVLDLMMPVMDGRAFVRECFLRSLGRPIPILLTSASPALRQAAEQLRPFGVRSSIPKPFDLIRLLELVARLTQPAVRLAAAR
jgi:CheY-like chemotaxis protein